MSSVLAPYKESKLCKKLTIHCRNNKTKLKKPIACIKCQLQDKRLTKRFDNIASIYQHIVYSHSGMDQNEYPTKYECIKKLQKLSDEMNGDVSK